MGKGGKIFRSVYEVKRRIRHRLIKNREISIITNNCLGGKLAHDFGLALNSPLINMQMDPEDFIRFCERMEDYLRCPLEEVKEIDQRCRMIFRKLGGEKIDFPVARIDDIYLYLQHYRTFEEAYDAWERRKVRIRKERFYILVVKADGQSRNIERFDSLQLQDKLIFTIDKPYQGEVSNSRYMCLNVPKGIHFMDREGRKFRYYYERFPFLKWFNGKMLYDGF